MFRENTLEQVVAEFNRYNRVQMTVAGKYATSRQLTGVFRADDPQSLVQFLEEDSALVISKWDSSIMINDK